MAEKKKTGPQTGAGFMKRSTMKVNQDRLMIMAGGFMPAKILLTANELGVFRFIGDRSRTAAEISAGLKLDPEATGILMGALVGLNLVTHNRGRFKNAPDVMEFLASGSDEGLACITNHLNHMYESWQGLDRVVKKGRPKKLAPSGILSDRKKNRDFICGMYEIGHETAGMLAEHLDLSGVKKMADIGGGPAQYPIAFSRKNPETRFVLADYPNTIRVARDYVSRHGLAGRIKLAVCRFFDVRELGIGEDFDMALLSQVLHAESDEKCLELLRKTHAILRPGGRIVINENARNDDGYSPTPPLVFAVNMLVATSGRTFTVKELSGWLKKAGFKGVRTKRLHERSVILEARK